MISEQIDDAYRAVGQACKADWKSRAASDAVIELSVIALRFLQSECDQISLGSRVHGKHYMTFSRSGVVARPVNCDLFVREPDAISNGWYNWLDHEHVADDFGAVFYTIALAPCLAMELFNRNNKKGPATFFEQMIGHLFSRSLGIAPKKKARLTVLGRPVQLTMDFLFESDSVSSSNVHLPVKMSTRERVVQAWSHQRLLDSAFGTRTYRGIMVVFCETKLDSRSHEVVEICVPGQWLVYQKLLASMDRIYYFDLPVRYRELTDAEPEHIQIRAFDQLPSEIASIVAHQR